MERHTEIATIERFLNVRLPPAYCAFLNDRARAVIAGHTFFGIEPIAGLSIIEATEMLRVMRPDLPQAYVALSFKGDACLCLDTSGGHSSPLIEISMQSGGKILRLPLTFVEYVQHFEKRTASYKIALRKLKNRKLDFAQAIPARSRQLRRTELKLSDAKQIIGRKLEAVIHSRAQDWHPRIFRLLDMVVAMSCFRYDFRSGYLEIDVFWAPDDPRCQRDEVLKWLAASVFADALTLGGSANLMFTRDLRENEYGVIARDRTGGKARRIPIPIPQELLDYAKSGSWQETGKVYVLRGFLKSDEFGSRGG